MTNKLFIDEDGDICVTDRENNLVALPARDDDKECSVLNPDVFEEMVRRYNEFENQKHAAAEEAFQALFKRCAEEESRARDGAKLEKKLSYNGAYFQNAEKALKAVKRLLHEGRREYLKALNEAQKNA